jgi:hypothetical protein
VAILQALFGRWVAGRPIHDPPPSGPGAAQQPKIDPDLGNMIVGSDDYPKHTFPPYAIFDKPKGYFTRLVDTVTAIIPGNGNRALFNRLILNPPSDTTERGWGGQASADVKAGCAANFNCGVPGHGDITGWEGTAVHEGSGIVNMAVGLMGYVFIGGAGAGARIVEAVSNYGFQPQAGHATSLIDRAYCFKAKVRPSPGTVTKAFSFVAEDGCGNGGIGYDEPAAEWAVKRGISAGRNEDPGTGVIHAEAGFKTREGGATHAGVTGTFTTVDGKTISVKNGIVTAIT